MNVLQNVLQLYCIFSTKRYIDILEGLVNRYNNTKHSSIKMTPVEASKKSNEFRSGSWEPWYNLHRPAKPIRMSSIVGSRL